MKRAGEMIESAPLRDTTRYKKTYIHLAFIFFIGGIVYLNALGGPFLFDDNVYVLNHPQIMDGGSLKDYLSKGFCEGALVPCPYYRPLVSLSLRLDYLIWGENPFGFHLTSLFFHLSVLSIFYLVIMLVFKDAVVALWTTLLFSLHPIHVESVAVISNRTDLPATFFILFSFLSFSLFLRRTPRSFILYFLSLFSFVFALFTKEISITLPFILLAYDLLFVRPWSGFRDLCRRWPSYLPFVVLVFIYLGVRTMAMESLMSENVYGIPLSVRLINVPILIQQYLSLLVIPYPLMIFHEVPQVVTVFDLEFLFSFFLIVSLMVLFIMLRRKRPVFLLGGFWFLITLFPVLNVIPFPSPAVMERSAYLPSIGFFLVIGFAWKNLFQLEIFEKKVWIKKAFVCIVSLVFLVFSVITVQRNLVWRDEIFIWEDYYSKLKEESPLGHFNLAKAYHLKGDLDLAEKEYLIGLKYSYQPIIFEYLGSIYQKQGRVEEAITEFRKAIELGTKNAGVYFNLGLEVLKKGDQEEAATLFQGAVRLNPEYQKARFQLGLIYTDRGERELAMAVFQELVRINPEDPLSHLKLAVLYDELGLEQKAAEQYILFLKTAKSSSTGPSKVVRAKKRLLEIQGRVPY